MPVVRALQLTVASIALLIVVATVVTTRTPERTAGNDVLAPKEDGGLADVLRLCQSLDPKELEKDQLCREAWTAEQRRFFPAPTGHTAE